MLHLRRRILTAIAGALAYGVLLPGMLPHGTISKLSGAGLSGSGVAHAQGVPPVFLGDPVDPATGVPYQIMPGVPLFLPGPDEFYGTGDDIIETGIVGDVDVVVRAGGTFTGGAIPPPAAGITAAPAVVAGGLHTGSGTEVAFQVVLSDGSSPPAAGNPLTGSQHDGRGVLVVAYPDLDGDGVVGPTNDDGSFDNEIERQETLAFAGRQVSTITGGVGAGTIGVTLGAPASAGGLGLVLVGGAVIGETAGKHFLDGPWVSTLAPFMLPLDPREVFGKGNVRPPDPENLVEVELEGERFGFLPAGHPVLGTPFAIPLDGSSISVDLVRSDAGEDASVNLTIPVDPATFIASSGRRVRAAVDASGERLVVEDVTAFTMRDDGPGNGRLIMLFVSDLLGNATDPAAPVVVTLEASPGVRLVDPDEDGDGSMETVVLDGAAAARIRVDDAGGAGDGGAGGRITALVDDMPQDSIRIDFGQVATTTTTTTTVTSTSVSTSSSTGPSTSSTTNGSSTTLGSSTTESTTTTSSSTSSTSTTTGGSTTTTTLLVGMLGVERFEIKLGKEIGSDSLEMRGAIEAMAGFDPSTQDVTLMLGRMDDGTIIYTRTIPAGSFEAKGSAFRFREDRSASERIATFVFQPRSGGGASTIYRLTVKIGGLDLASLLVSVPDVVVETLQVGAATFAADLRCAPNARDTGLVCVP